MKIATKRWQRHMAVLIGLWLVGGTSVWAAPLSMEEAVKLAFTNNLDIKLSANQMEQAQYGLESAKGSQSFSIDAKNNFYLKKANEAGSTSSSSVTVSMPLYSGGKNEGNIAVADINVKMADLALAKSRQDVKLNTITAYLAIINAQKVQQVAQETVDNYALHLENVKAQYEVGNIAKSDVLRSEVELADAQQTLMQDQTATETAVNALKKIMRWNSAEPLEVVGEFQYVPLAQSLDTCIQAAKQQRPDLAKYRLSVQSAQESIHVAEADRKPAVSLEAGLNWNDAFANSTNYVGVASSWNLFDGNVTKANVNKAKSAVTAAQLTLASQEDSAEKDVKDYYLSMKEAEQRREPTQLAVHKAEEDYFIAKEKYKVGEGILLDVIDAQLALSTAKNNYINAQYDYAVNKAKLENAMGMD